MGIGTEGTDSVYPGILAPNITSEFAQRQFYRRWLEFMTSESWPAICE